MCYPENTLRKINTKQSYCKKKNTTDATCMTSMNFSLFFQSSVVFGGPLGNFDSSYVEHFLLN